MAVMRTLPPFSVIPLGITAPPQGPQQALLSGRLIPKFSEQFAADARALTAHVASLQIPVPSLWRPRDPAAQNAAANASAPHAPAPRAETRKPELLEAGSMREHMIEQALVEIDSADKRRQRDAFDRLVGLREPRLVPRLLAALEAPTSFTDLLTELWNKQYLITTLEAFGDPRTRAPLTAIVERHIAQIRSPKRDTPWQSFVESEIAANAAHALGTLRDPRSFELLLDLFQLEPEPHNRGALARALGRQGDLRAVPILISRLAEKMLIEETSDILRALGLLRDERSFAALLAALSSPSKWIMGAALSALGRQSDVRAVPHILPFTSAKAVHVRAAALEALGMINEPASIEHLFQAAGDRGQVIAPAVIRGLASTKSPRAYQHFVEIMGRQSGPSQMAAVEALETWGDPRAIDILLNRLKHRSARTWWCGSVRYKILGVLGRIGDERAVGALRSISQGDTEEAEMREEAALVLEQLEERLRK